MAEAVTPPPIPLQRPRLVWVIFLFYAISGGAGLLIQLEMFAGLVKFPPDQQAMIGDLSTGVQLFAIAGGILNIVAATSLWLLRKAALPLFSLVLLVSIGSILWHLQPGGMFSRVSAQGAAVVFGSILGVGFGIISTIAICCYTWHLWRRGVLK